MDNKIISLSIYGNKQANGGFAALIVYGPRKIEVKDEPTSIKEDGTVYKIKHTVEQTFYSLYSSKVKSYDGEREGTLVITLAIPADASLAGNESPYDLLNNIYLKFLADYTIQDSDGYYKFKEGDYNREPIENIIKDYPLTERTTRYIEMKGTQKAIVCAPTEEALRALFLDSQYNEFANCSEIEIGKNCTPTLRVEIPRKPVYEVYVNGKLERSVSDEAEAVSVTANSSLPFYQEYKSVRFTLYELLKSTNGIIRNENGTVQVDKINERIYCTIQPVDKEIVYRTELRADLRGEVITEKDWQTIKKELQVVIHGRDVTASFIKNESIKLTGRENERKQLNFSKISGFAFTQGEDSNLIALYVKKHPLEIKKPKIESEEKKMDLIYLQVNVDAQDEYSIEVKNADKDFFIRQFIWPEETGKVYKGTRTKVRSIKIPLEKSWRGKTVFVEIFRNNKTESYEEEITLSSVINELPVKSSYFKECIPPISWYIRRSTLIAIIAAVCFIGGAVLGGVAYHLLWGDTKPQTNIQAAGGDNTRVTDVNDSISADTANMNNNVVVNAGTPPVPTGEENTKEDQPMQMRSRADEIKEILQKDDLTFADVSQLAQSHSDETLVKRYKRVVDAITGKKMHSIQNKDLNALTKYQQYAITGITYGQTVKENNKEETFKYNNPQKTRIKKLLENKTFSSFVELTTFHKTIWDTIKTENIR